MEANSGLARRPRAGHEMTARLPGLIQNETMDIGVNLVENYLRLTGYLTLTEFEVQRRAEDGTFQTITDVDVVALRSPGPVYVGDPHTEEDCGILLIEDPALELEEDLADVIIGEVKQGEAEFNPGLKDHRVLHAVVRRLEWLYDGPVDEVVTGLQREGVHIAQARGGGRIRTRLVAFGRGPSSTLNRITHSHMVQTLLGFFDQFEEAFRPVQFKDPAPALLRLLLKAGFTVEK